MLGVGYAQPAPDLRGFDIEAQDVLSVQIQNASQPGFQRLSLLGIAAMPNEFDATPVFTDRDDRQEKRITAACRLRQERDDPSMRPNALAGFADDVGVNQKHGVLACWRSPG